MTPKRRLLVARGVFQFLPVLRLAVSRLHLTPQDRPFWELT